MRAYGETDIGQVRKTNQDSIFCSHQSIGNLPNLYIVADGMGGHKAGDYASKFAIQKFVEVVENAAAKTIPGILQEALEAVNEALLLKASSDDEYEGMGTTCVAAVVDNNILYVMNIGDSRLYVAGDGQIDQVSVDHSLVGEMVRSGVLTKEEAKHHPDRNIITRAVGVEHVAVPDFFEYDLKQGQYILLCSDGLSNMLDDEEILSIISTENEIDQKVHSLIDMANKKGGSDNITALLIDWNSAR